jgi:hypothetical protein
LLCSFCKREMGDAEWAGVSTQLRQTSEQFGIRTARKQRGKQRVLTGARDIHLVHVVAHLAGEEVRAQHTARNACRGFDGEHALGRDAVPIRDRRLGNANATRKLAYAANGTDRLLEPLISHLPISWAPERRIN